MIQAIVIANGARVETKAPCTIGDFLLTHQLHPQTVVVEHNGEAVAPSEFARRIVNNGDRLEIVKVVAGG